MISNVYICSFTDVHTKRFCVGEILYTKIVTYEDLLHYNKIFSFKTKKSIVAKYEYMNSLKILSTISSSNFFWFSQLATEITKYLLLNLSQVWRAILNIQPNSSSKMSIHQKCTPRLGTIFFRVIYNNNKPKSENIMILRMCLYMHVQSYASQGTWMCEDILVSFD